MFSFILIVCYILSFLCARQIHKIEEDATVATFCLLGVIPFFGLAILVIVLIIAFIDNNDMDWEEIWDKILLIKRKREY